MTRINERPLLLMVDPKPDPQSKALPARMYEESLHGHSAVQLVEAPFQISADEVPQLVSVTTIGAMF